MRLPELVNNLCGILGMRRKCSLPTTSRPANTVNLTVETVSHSKSLRKNNKLIVACKRGSPQYISGSQMNEDEPVSNCQTASSCANNFECTSVGSMQLCCPTVSSICSNAGGRPNDLLRSTNFDPGQPMKRTYSLTYSTSSRYYYDSEQGRCIAFTYHGALGNVRNIKINMY